MADKDQIPTDDDVSDTDLDKVTGGDFTKIGGVAGESTDDKHKDTIHISS